MPLTSAAKNRLRFYHFGANPRVCHQTPGVSVASAN